MSVGIDLGTEAGSPDERVVRRHRTIVAKPQNLAGMMARVLGARSVVPLADGHEERPVAPERQLRSEMQRAACAPGIGHEDVLDIRERLSVEPAARERRRVTSLTGFRIRQVDEAVLREAGMQRNLEQAALPHGVNLRDPGDRLRIERSVAHDSQAADLLGHEHVAVRQERQAPWKRESSHDGHHANRLRDRLHLLRCGRRRQWRDARVRSGGSLTAPCRRAALTTLPLPGVNHD